MGAVRHFFLLLFLLLGACSMRTALDALSSEQDRAFAQEMVSRLRAGDRAWLERHFDPELWTRSREQVASAPALFPEIGGKTELIGFNMSTNIVDGRTQRSKQFTLATEGGGRWAVTSFQTYSTGGPDRVVQWSVAPHSERPPEVAMIEAWEAVVPWVWAGMAAVLLAMTALIFWLVRRSRRREA